MERKIGDDPERDKAELLEWRRIGRNLLFHKIALGGYSQQVFTALGFSDDAFGDEEVVQKVIEKQKEKAPDEDQKPGFLGRKKRKTSL